jgi:diguanylate cyclase (GGDEF)-like protein
MHPAQAGNSGKQEMLAVRRRRRLRLCQILTVLGVIFLFSFGFLSLTKGLVELALILLACSIVGLINLLLLHRTGNVERAATVLSGILFVLSMTLLITGGANNTGILWIYPIIAINLFINRYWPAVVVFGLFGISSSLLLFTPLSEWMLASYSLTEAIRFELSILAQNLICLAALRSEERAYQTILQLHDDDIRKLAYYDTLTGLPNRWSFRTNLERLLARAEQDRCRVGLLYIDLDNFKQVNDQHGHEAGDRLLLKFSERLWDVVRPTDVVNRVHTDSLARLAGDEFVVMLPGINSPLDTAVVAQRVLDLFAGGFQVDSFNHSVYASIGIAVYPDDAGTSAELLHHADVAMYHAKRDGRNCFRFFTEELARSLRQRQRIEQGLKQALSANQFSLVYMPMFTCLGREIVGIEVLLRCHSPQLDGIGPDRFIPVAEATGLIKELDLWVLKQSLISLGRLQTDHHFTGKLCINMSGVELHNEQFPEQVRQQLEKHRIDPASVELEVTETAFVAGDAKSIEILTRLRGLGISLALDGTGYTAFSQLMHYPADCLKIDRSFVNDLFSERDARNKMVRIIQSLAKLYELRVVAEGVETEAQLDYLRDSGCDWVQGYYLSKPLVWDDLVALLEGSA